MVMAIPKNSRALLAVLLPEMADHTGIRRRQAQPCCVGEEFDHPVLRWEAIPSSTGLLDSVESPVGLLVSDCFQNELVEFRDPNSVPTSSP